MLYGSKFFPNRHCIFLTGCTSGLSFAWFVKMASGGPENKKELLPFVYQYLKDLCFDGAKQLKDKFKVVSYRQKMFYIPSLTENLKETRTRGFVYESSDRL